MVLWDWKVPVRFDASACGSTVEVRSDGGWRRGRLVELVRGREKWGVAFEDGGWAEEVRVGDAGLRYVFAGGRGGAGAEAREGGRCGRWCKTRRACDSLLRVRDVQQGVLADQRPDHAHARTTVGP